MDDELKNEEVEVLKSIYCGDENFKEIGRYHFQYKFGEDNSLKSILLEIKWTLNYPTEVPEIILENFYNKKIPSDMKAELQKALKEEAENYLDTPMTYSLFEWMKDNYEEYLKNFETPYIELKADDDMKEEGVKEVKLKVRKEQLTKSQKKKLYDRLDATGERPRGWDWVDIVRHLSQSGPKQTTMDS